MSILKFLTKKSTLLCLGLLLLLTFVVPAEVWAQGAKSATTKQWSTGPFEAFLQRAARLFFQTRNALFVVAVFAFVAYAWSAIEEGKIEWKKLFYLTVGLVILGVAGWFVSYMANPNDSNKVITTYDNYLGNTQGWE